MSDAKGFAGFSMAKAPKRIVSSAVAQAPADDEDDDEHVPATTELVNELVEGKVDVPSEGPRVISGQGNTFHLGGAQHLREKLDAPAGESEATGGPAAHVPAPAEAAAVSADMPADTEGEALSEDARAARALLEEVQMGGSSSIFNSNDDTERYRLDVATRADEADTDAYAKMPIEDFGKAYLRGYNWNEGAGLGKDGKGAVEPIEYVPRPQLLGLGAQPKAPDEGHGKKKKFIKPGESREPKKDMIYVDDQGRQRHVKKVGEKLTERGPSGFNKGAVVAITSGPHEGLYARIVSSGGLAADLRLVLRLTMNGTEVTVPASHCESVKDLQLEKQRPGFTHEQATKAMAEAKADEDAATAAAEEEGEEGHGAKHKKHKREREEKEHKRQKEHKRHKDEKGHRDEKAHKHSKEHGGGGGGGGGGGCGARLWVRENIRVRIVDKRLQNGALYNKKGAVVDVSGPDHFSVRMDDSGRLVEGLRHSIVETALPKAGGAVLVLAGEHRMRRGKLLERRSADAIAMVQLGSDLKVVELSFDDVAEWVGGLGESLDVAEL